MFSLESINRLAGERSGGNRAVIYARVSSIKQKRDGNLDQQTERLLKAAKERGYRIVEVIAEQASGINEKRRGLRRIFPNRFVGTLLVERHEGGLGRRYVNAEFRSAQMPTAIA